MESCLNIFVPTPLTPGHRGGPDYWDICVRGGGIAEPLIDGNYLW